MKRSFGLLLKYVDKRMLKRGALLFFINILFIAVCLWPTWTNAGKLKDELKQVENNLIRAQKKINDLPKLQKEQKEYTDFIAEFEAAMIKDSRKTALIGEISDFGRIAGVEIMSMKPVPYTAAFPDDVAEFYKPLSYELILKSKYHQVATLVNKIERMPEYIKLESCSILPSEEEKGKLSIKLVLSTYAKI